MRFSTVNLLTTTLMHIIGCSLDSLYRGMGSILFRHLNYFYFQLSCKGYCLVCIKEEDIHTKV